MDLTLHLGAHRTGATTFQQFLLGNVPALRQKGIAVWTPRETRRGMYAGLVRRPEAVTLACERTGRRSVGVLGVRQACLERQGVRRLIVSEQNMIGTPEHCLARQRLYPWPGERLARFLPAFEPRCDRIVLTIRSYEGFWASVLAQAAMAGHPLPRPSLLDRLVTQPLRWRRLVEEVAAAFPRAQVVVLPFERFVSMPERQLSAMTGEPLPVGLAVHMAGVRDWHRRSPLTGELRRVMCEDSGDLPGSVPADSSSRWQPFDAAQRVAFAAQYAEDLAWLRSGANGHATLIARADAKELRTVDRTGGCTSHDGIVATQGLGGTCHQGTPGPAA